MLLYRTLRLDPRKMIPPPGAEKHERPKSFLTPRKIQKSWEERCRGCMAKSPFQDIHVQIVWPKLWDFNDLNSPYNKYTFSHSPRCGVSLETSSFHHSTHNWPSTWTASPNIGAVREQGNPQRDQSLRMGPIEGRKRPTAVAVLKLHRSSVSKFTWGFMG